MVAMVVPSTSMTHPKSPIGGFKLGKVFEYIYLFSLIYFFWVVEMKLNLSVETQDLEKKPEHTAWARSVFVLNYNWNGIKEQVKPNQWRASKNKPNQWWQ